MSKLLLKVKNYLNQKYLIKNVDNKHWSLTDNFQDKVTTILKEEFIGSINELYPHIDLDSEKKNNPSIYTFLVHRFTRYIYRVNDCLIEPDYNWVILGKQKLFKYSYPLIEDPWDNIKPRPSVLAGIFKKKPVELEKAILVKYNWNNYYHFFSDLLPQLYLCDDNAIAENVPLIVPANYNRLPFVADFFKYFPLKRKIIVQSPGQYFQVKELYVAKDFLLGNYPSILREKVIAQNIADLSPEINSPELLYITRKKGTKRSISNADEIEKIAVERGFTVIDPGDYNWIQQVKLFSEVKKIIGVHGAGLTNILFCKNNDVQLFEIFPGNGIIPEHYENMSKKLGYRYASMTGNGLNSEQTFSVDKSLFVENIDRFF